MDGTFLKWNMIGMLLVACGRDPNDQMFHVAWSIVDCENTKNCFWFLGHLVDDLRLGTENGTTLASDQQKGLIAAVRIVLPFAEHRLCARHIYTNWKKKYVGAEFECLFWAAADSYYPQQFDRNMQNLKLYSTNAYNDLKISITCPWSRAFFTEFSKCDVVENNLGESFNTAIRIARTKPVVEMLEDKRKKVMVSNERKRTEAFKLNGDYTPRSKALLEQHIDLAKNCRPLSCGLGRYEVAYYDYKTNTQIESFVVHKRGDISCSCRKYLITGIPCCHIVYALRQERNDDQYPKTLISQWFTAEKLRTCYIDLLQPVNGMIRKVTTDFRLQPPIYKKPPGRPRRKKRHREKGEPRPGKVSKRGTKVHCTICGEEGHNKRYCKNDPKPKLPKRACGRQQKQATTLAAPLLLGSQSQTNEIFPSLSSALPRKPENASSQPAPPSQQPMYNT